jgi:putative ABC transport system permease protein
VRIRTAPFRRWTPRHAVDGCDRRNSGLIGGGTTVALAPDGPADRMFNPGTLDRVATSLRSTPLLSIAAVLCAAIGVSATTAAAALFSAVAVRGVPFPDADRLVRVWLADTASGETRGSLSIPELRDLDGRVAAFDAFLGTARSRAVGLLDSGTERLRGEGVTPDYFPTLGLRALHGRLLTAPDFAADAPRVTVISARFWAGRFGADPQVIGRPLRTEAAVFTIVGVAPTGFDGTVESDIIDFWMPLAQYLPAALIDNRTGRSAWAIARLAPGVTPAAAQAELAGHLGAWAAAHPALYRDLQLRVEPMGDNWRGSFTTGAALLLGAVILLLVIASLNVAGLLVARTIDRRHELAMRAALGAGRATLVGDLVLEALLLAAIGGAIGAMVAPTLLDAVVAFSPMRLPPYLRLRVDGLAVAIAAAAILGAGLVAALAPAWLTSRVEPGDVLRGVGRGSLGGDREQRWGAVLVGAEVALTLALLVTGSLLLRSFQMLNTWDVGFRVDGMTRLALTFSRADAADAAALPAAYERVRQAIAVYPGVERVGLVATTLPPWDADRGRVRFAGLPENDRDEGLSVGLHLADEGLLPTLEVPLVAGRRLAATDHGASPVAVISRALADRMGGPDQALGRLLQVLPGGLVPETAARVIGVVENVAYDGLAEQGAESGGTRVRTDAAWLQDRYDAYLPLSLAPQRIVSIGVATSGDAAALIPPLKRVIAQVAPTSAVHWDSAMADEVQLEFASTRFFALLVNAYSLGALALTATGVFAMLSHLVARRRSEIGLRLALGGESQHVIALIARLTAVPLGVGVVSGWALAAALAAAATSLLFGVERFDVASYALGTAVLVACGVIAAVVPARRALTIDPMRTMRSE